MRRQLLPRLVAGLFAVSLLVMVTGAGAGSAALTNRLIVKFKPPAVAGDFADTAAERLERLNARAGMKLLRGRTLSDNSEIYVLPEWMPEDVAAGVAARLAAEPAVEYAEADRLRRPLFVPNDTLYVQQWNLFEDAGGVRLPDAWDQERGAPNIIIALLDNGILDHGDLDPARLVPGYDFISDAGIANDGDGRDADPADPGDWTAAGECVSGEPALPSSWHGTEVTGLVGAATDNGAGIAGVTHGTRLLMVRVLGRCGGFTSDIVEAIRWAAGLPVPGVPDNANPARVINLSFGGEGACSRSEQNAIDDVNARGTVVMAAAGNNAGDVSTTSPASCRGVVTVAATTRAGGKTAYTNTGAGVEVSAPGGDAGDGILVLSNTGDTIPAVDDFLMAAGTSYSTAHVSGVAALLLSVNADLNPLQVADILAASARPFADASCNPSICGSGIVDASAAVQLAAATQGEPDSDNDGVDDVVDLCPGTPAGEPVDADGCSDSQLNGNGGGGGGGGGGGCTVSHATVSDPLLLLLLIVAVVNLAAHRRRL
ncbi:MAG: S8 family peptidase [Gammaproteobacteria bacterium]|nr:MAG: S8 family peptidase [Gammaproteobacteria bacterium]